ncbi:SAV_915 family protein [Streptomyces gardneri]|uniref:SAV_915 family protein n=1 Tax=Streptomyces gardneri TaxID=66892 RepID=UPI0036B7906D
MADALSGDDAEPFEQPPAPAAQPPAPAAQPRPPFAQPPAAGRLCVPVRPSAGGWATRLFRTPVGGRTAVAFTDPARLRAVLGADQPWILLSEPALRALAEPLGVHELRIDPAFTAPAPAAVPTPTATRTPVAAPRPLTALAG